MLGKQSSGYKQHPDPKELVVKLYRDYSSDIEENLWPWETARWYELVFCILTTIGEPQVPAGITRRLTNILSEMELLDIGALAKLASEDIEEITNPLFVTINTLLKQAGFSSEKSKSAVKAICEAALGIKEKYGGKVQNYFRKYGEYMLHQSGEDFGFSQFDDAQRALSIWLQNTINMPIPASNTFADKACESLGITYDELVKAANQQDLNIALLDDALRAFWGNKLIGKESGAGESE